MLLTTESHLISEQAQLRGPQQGCWPAGQVEPGRGRRHTADCWQPW